MSLASIGVIVAHDDPRVVEQIAERIESAPDLFVAATAPDGARADVLVAGGEALITLRAQDVPVIALASEGDLRAARAALGVPARDLVAWPAEADRLPGAIRAAASQARGARERGGAVVAVFGARGGAGASTAAAIVAASLEGAILLDLGGGGQRSFCVDEPARTLERANGTLGDIAPDALVALLTDGPAGARTLHAAPLAPPLDVAQANGLVRASRAAARVTVVDCGCCADAGARAAVASADARIAIALNDVASVRGIRALRDALGARFEIIVRRARRDGVPLRDLAAAFGAEPRAVVSTERSLSRAADLGALPERPTRAMRAFASIGRDLVR